MLVATGWLFVVIPKGFLPSEDTGSIFAFTEAAEGISFEAMKRHQQALGAIVKADPNVEQFMSFVGPRGASTGGNTGILFIRLKPRRERALSVDEVIQELRPKLAQVPGIRAFLQNPPPIRIGGQLTKSQYQYTLQGSDTDALYAAARAAAGRRCASCRASRTSPPTSRSRTPTRWWTSTATRRRPRAVGPPDRRRPLLGLRHPADLDDLRPQQPVPGDPRAATPSTSATPPPLDRLYVRSATGQLVPLSAVARIYQDVGPLSVNHQGQLPAVTLSFNLAPGVSLVRRRQGGRPARPADPAGGRLDQLPGHRPGLPVVAPGAPACC